MATTVAGFVREVSFAVGAFPRTDAHLEGSSPYAHLPPLRRQTPRRLRDAGQITLVRTEVISVRMVLSSTLFQQRTRVCWFSYGRFPCVRASWGVFWP